MYSGHDSTVAALLNTLGVFRPPELSPYGALVSVELRTRGGSGFFVRASYRDDPSREPRPLWVPGCPDADDCPLARFDSLTRHLRPDDWRRECGLRGEEEEEDAAAAAAVVAVVVVVALAAAAVVAAALLGFSRHLLRRLCARGSGGGEGFARLENSGDRLRLQNRMP